MCPCEFWFSWFLVLIGYVNTQLVNVNLFIISRGCKDSELSISSNLYHIELLPIFFYRPFLCFIPYTNINLSPSSSVSDVSVNLAWRSMRFSRNPSENSPNIFLKIVNSVEKTLFFSEAVGSRQCKKTTKWCGLCHVKQTKGPCFSSELFHHFISIDARSSLCMGRTLSSELSGSAL